MARILDQEEQKKALKNINASIKEIETANEFMAASNPTGQYSITFTGEDDKKYTTTFTAESKEDIDLLIEAHKANEKNRITKLAEDNRIALDDDDIAVLGV